jgi:hypothetical protein
MLYFAKYQFEKKKNFRTIDSVKYSPPLVFVHTTHAKAFVSLLSIHETVSNKRLHLATTSIQIFVSVSLQNHFLKKIKNK